MRISDSLVIKLLTNSKDVSKDKIDALKKHEAADKKALQYLAVKEGLISEENLVKLYAKEIDMPFVDLDPKVINPECLKLLPKRVAKKYRAIVFNVSEDGSYELAMEDPEDVQSVIYLRKLLSNQLKLFVATEGKIQGAIEKIDSRKESSLKPIDISEDEEVSTGTISNTINELVNQGIKAGASDIHIEPRQDIIVVRFRIDGSLREYHKLPIKMLSGLLDQIKLIGGLSNSESMLPQSGKFRFESGDQTRTISVATMPVLDGEKVVMRIIDESAEASSFSDLGLWGKSLSQLNKIIAKPQGLVLVSGPIGSGRSTTLFSILSKLYSPTVNMATIEDPVEHRLSGTNQTAVNLASGITFAVGLKAILQHDPNVILVSELRDSETAELAIHAAHKGHLLLSSLFTSNAAGAIKRLRDIGVEPHQTASTLNGVISQRLVRRLCTACATTFTPSSSQLKQLKQQFDLNGNNIKELQSLEKEAVSERLGSSKSKSLSSGAFTINKLWQENPDGCSDCDFTGFKGRIGLFEVLVNSEEITKTIVADKPAAEVEKIALMEGMVKMKLDGLVKALRGLTSIEEVIQATSNA